MRFGACVVILISSTSLSACGGSGDDVDLSPTAHLTRAAPQVLDTGLGTFGGVQVGDTRAQALKAASIRLPNQPDDGGSAPLDVCSTCDSAAASNWRPPGGGRSSSTLRYQHHTVLIGGPKGPGVYGFITTDPHAQTERTVGIGDTLGYAHRRYPTMVCDVTKTEFVTYPACHTKLGPHRYLSFGGNPIRSISLMTVTFDGIT